MFLEYLKLFIGLVILILCIFVDDSGLFSDLSKFGMVLFSLILVKFKLLLSFVVCDNRCVMLIVWLLNFDLGNC